MRVFEKLPMFIVPNGSRSEMPPIRDLYMRPGKFIFLPDDTIIINMDNVADEPEDDGTRKSKTAEAGEPEFPAASQRAAVLPPVD